MKEIISDELISQCQIQVFRGIWLTPEEFCRVIDKVMLELILKCSQGGHHEKHKSSSTP